jgi:hypothetical protein
MTSYTKEMIERYLRLYAIKDIKMKRDKVLVGTDGVEQIYYPSDEVEVKIVFNLKESAK